MVVAVVVIGLGGAVLARPLYNYCQEVELSVTSVCKPDLCPNIEGKQYTVPEGLIVDNEGNCVEPPVEETPPVTTPTPTPPTVTSTPAQAAPAPVASEPFIGK